MKSTENKIKSEPAEVLREIRCSCGYLLFKISADVTGMIEIRCKKCRIISRRHFANILDDSAPVVR